MAFVWVFGWMMVAAALALVALVWSAMRAMDAGARVTGWALLALAGALAILPRVAERAAAGGPLRPVLLASAAPFMVMAALLLWRLRPRAPVAATAGIATLAHAALALAALAAMSEHGAALAIPG